MHVEIQVALNFLISFLYNKLPRRRVNQFGEELENALKIKFEGHWYPEKPYKGSAYRCVRCTPPLDPTVFDTAARACGMELMDIQENLPQELSIWIDPGEVSYRMSEKGPVKILYSEKSENNIERENLDREVTRTFNPEAQCFKPIECMTSQFGGLNLSNGNTASNSFNGETSPPAYKNSVSPISAFMVSKTSTPVTFTTATFAATKFGSTKLKSNSKRSHRMSPTEFSNYIKQRAILQQQASTQQQSPVGMSPMATNNPLFSATSTSTVSPHNSRSLSPNSTQMDSANNFMLMATGNGANSPTSPNGTYGSGPQSPYSSNNSSTPSNRAAFISGLFDNNYLSELVGNGELAKPNPTQHQQNKANGMNRFTSFLDKASPFISNLNNPSLTGVSTSAANSFNGLSADSTVNGSSGTANNSSKAFDNINYNLNGVSYPNQYQHLLVAN
jgi:protein Tob/BTG